MCSCSSSFHNVVIQATERSELFNDHSSKPSRCLWRNVYCCQPLLNEEMMKDHKCDDIHGHVEVEPRWIGSYFEQKFTDGVSFLLLFHAVVLLATKLRLHLVCVSHFLSDTLVNATTREMKLAQLKASTFAYLHELCLGSKLSSNIIQFFSSF